MTKASLLETILPPLLMSAVTAGVGLLIGRGIYMIVTVAATIMTTIFSTVRFFKEKKACRRENKEREAMYDAYLLEKRKELYQAYEKEKESYAYHYPKIGILEKKISRYDARIYEKSYLDEDFLAVWLGYGERRPMRGVFVSGGEELKTKKDELEQEAQSLASEYTTIEAPVVLDLKKENLGLVGDAAVVSEQVKLLLLRLAFFHSYRELNVVLVYDEKREEEYRFLRFLPHMKLQSLNVLGMIDNDRSRDQVMGSVYRMLKQREVSREEKEKEKNFLPHLLFVIDYPALIMDHPIMEFLERKEKGLGYSVIYTAHMQGNLPENMDTVVLFERADTAKMLMRNKQETGRYFVPERLSEVSAEWMVRNLSAICHVPGMENHIPESITFFELYKAENPGQLNAPARWQKNRASKTLAVPLGVRGKEDYVQLNLHEKAHGPHGLVAGTTGSGKSEIVQSYILSLAVNYHPYEVGFLLIDYKGGGMAALFEHLPHLLGTITNLDGAESMRAMASIKSELARRQQLFNDYNVNHINGYQRLFHEGVAKEPLPHLFLISDEFAELKKEQPDFMRELVSAARIGRSLGIHLILATQKPTGVVDDQIWSNSRFKLALKVQNEADSKEILKTADAASIVQPGRAYLQVGNNEIYELFQSAWSGATYKEKKETEEADNRVYLINDLGQGELLNEDLSEEENESGNPVTELDVTVAYLQSVAQATGVRPVKKPWLPPLPAQYVTVEMPRLSESKIPDLSLHLGLVDLPESQAQEVYAPDLADDGNLLYVAASGYGRTVFLTTAVLSLAYKNHVDALQFYLLDFGNSGLIALNSLHHTADYMTLEDMEKLSKFRAFLEQEMKERRKLLGEAVAQNVTVYNSHAEEPLKALCVVLDNYDVVKELGLEWEEFFLKVARDGAGLGIYVMFTATRGTALRFNLLNTFKNRIVGFLLETAEINQLLGRSSIPASEGKGRTLIKWGGNIAAMQVAVPFAFADETDYNRKLAEMIEEINALYPGQKAARLAILPDVLTYPMLKDYESEQNVLLPLALDKETVQVCGVGMDTAPFAIVGDTRKGKTNVLKMVLKGLQKMAGEPKAAGAEATQNIYLFDSESMELYGFKEMEQLSYIRTEEETEQFITELTNLVTTRKQTLTNWLETEAGIHPKELALRFEPIYVVVDDWDVFVEKTRRYADALIHVLNSCGSVGVRIIFSASAGKLRGFDEISKFAKASINGLLLSHSGNTGMFPLRTIRDTPQETGDALLFSDGNYRAVKVARAEEEE